MASNNDTSTITSTTSKKEYVYTTLLLDMDGVLAEVSKSYRVAIEQTCHFYGAKLVTQNIITEWKARGNANDDWKLSYDLIQQKIYHLPNNNDILQPQQQLSDITLQQVTDTFESYYQGTESIPGLYTLETLIPKRSTLEELHRRTRYRTSTTATGTTAIGGMGIVTGRPKSDCIKFLRQYNIEHLFDAMYCMEDGPSKPNPYPIQRCCELLHIKTPNQQVVLIGDTPDDITATTSAGCSGIGVITPEVIQEIVMNQNNNNSNTMDMDMDTILHSAPLAMIMKNKCGADMILPPGFEALIDMFPNVPTESTEEAQAVEE